MLKFVLLILISVSLNAKSCAVLLYHHFSDEMPKSTSISPKLFEQHLQYLQVNEFKVLPLKTLLSKLKDNDLPDRCVVLTTDDAYQSIYTNAYPLLKKYQMPMAVFVATQAIDKNYKAMMSWNQMREIQGEYVKFYNHTAAHSHLLDLNKAQVKTQIEQAQNSLYQALGTTDKVLAYPYGESNLSILKQVEELDYIAFGQQSGVVSKASDLQNLPRFPMAANFAKMKSFQLKVNTLPMPLVKKRINPIIDKNPPMLNLTFEISQSKPQQDGFNCFANGGVDINWKDDKNVEIVAKKPLMHRRNKYNCTMPSQSKEKYYWHSVQWINPSIAE